ncbi:MAG: 4-alpha-glucanotransferase [Planctomycetota bacterium]
MPLTDRAAGILLHPTCLSGPHGIGSLGPEAHAFIDALAENGFRLWQILPLGPAGYGNSPYSGYSSFAGNPLLISLAPLLEKGRLREEDLAEEPAWPEGRVAFDAVAAWKLPILRIAHERFLSDGEEKAVRGYRRFCQAQAGWLDEYTLFMALKTPRDGAPWMEWEAPLRRRAARALKAAAECLAGEIDFHRFLQFLFDSQWQALRAHCGEAGVKIVGDVPIFVPLDSAEVWTHQRLFHLDREGHPRKVAGVPPDYFTATGQLWGNPLYRWREHKKTGYAWWLDRLAHAFHHVDALRIDHFRAFEAYWEIPGGSPTAETGRWVKGPGADFLAKVEERFGALPLMAENLGVITPEVEALRERFHLPGMRVLHFAFGEEDPRHATHAPHNHTPESVVYTGTHDNDTTLGWFHGKDFDFDRRPEALRATERRNLLAYLGTEDASEIHWRLMRLAFGSVGRTAVAPIQDVLGLGSDARMNRPGTFRPDNWSWRLTSAQAARFRSPEVRDRLRELLWRYGRL